ncbi:lipoyl protein ligase domain-containing protein [Natrarchaeobaculum aegyptiacum]|uniref:Lipoate--protein ligase n=1 Tax=Natrarchaeobaculum aegyptiacum TaxID=745377 RepID=A0A2Z2HS00_9EURY|nr:lipoate--protein ligase family protein [Natrarchaeobaculum aegyptiacum]ARS89889.1 lipoate--protein ligase [Natrarchaeobaculum aegyptiacum]
MYVYRGRAADVTVDRSVSERLLEHAAGGDSAVRVWTPHRQFAFGRRDRRLEGYDRARERARDRGFPPLEREVGGRAVAYDGETTLAFARAAPVADLRRGTDERYERVTAAVENALREVGLDSVQRGEPANSFCPGAHSLSVTRGAGLEKVVGIAQRVRHDAALTAGIVVVDRRDELATALEAVYDALEVPFDPASVGSVATGDGPTDPDAVAAALENALVGDRSATIRSVDTLVET